VWPTSNTHLGILISNQFGEPTNLDIRGSKATISPQAFPGKTGVVVVSLYDQGNGNKLTCCGAGTNPTIFHYWTDINGNPYLEGGNCAEMSKGYCVSNGIAVPVKLPIATLTANAPCNAGNEGAHAVAKDCNALCTAGNACIGGGGTHCEVYCNATPAWVETGR